MFLANENLPKPSVELLRSNGFVVRSIQEEVPGISDAEVVQIALQENLIILTFDRDYGELIFRYGKKKQPGVIYFRDKGTDPLFAGQVLSDLLAAGQIKFNNAFTVIESNNVRQRFY